MPILQSGGWRIDYVDEGQGPAVLLIHSASSSHRQWRPMIDFLKPGYRMVAMNLFGYGDTSAWPSGRQQTVADHLELIVPLMDKLPGKIHLVGHSLGGVLALEAALLRRDKVASLAVYEPNPFHLSRDYGDPAAFHKMVGLMDEIETRCQQGDPESAARFFMSFWSDDAAWEAMSDRRKATLTAAIHSSIHEGRSLERNTTPIQAYASLAMPVLFMYAQDTNPVILEVLQLLERACPHWQVLRLPEGGHLAPLTQPEVVNTHIANFIANSGEQ